MKLHPTRSSFEDVVLTARPAFSKRSWKYVLALALPWLLLAGQRCMTRLALLGGARRSLSAYYRFLSHGKWRLQILYRSLFDLIVQTFPAPSLTLVVDDTLRPKWGRGIFGTASHWDHAARPRAGYIWGHNWIVLAVVVPIGRLAWVALPCWVELYRPQKICRKGEFRTKLELAGEALRVIRTWYPGPILVLADGAYNNSSLGTVLRELDMHLVSRLRSDARLRSIEIPRRPRGTRGRKPKYGPRPAVSRHPRAPNEVVCSPRGRHLREARAAPGARSRSLLARTRLPDQARDHARPEKPEAPRVSLHDRSRHVGRRGGRPLLGALADRTALLGPEEQPRLRLGRGPDAQLGGTSCGPHDRAADMGRGLGPAKEPAIWRVQSFSRKLSALREQTVASIIFASGPRTRRSDRIAKGLSKLFSTATRAA